MNSPQFPNYQNPVEFPAASTLPGGIPLPDPKYQKPLNKLMRQMMKPKQKSPTKLKSRRKGKKKVGFY